MFAMLTILAVLLFIVLDTNDAIPTKVCKVPNADGGTCTLLINCKPLLDISKKKQKTDMEDRFFRQSVASCGSRGTKLKVCCPPASQWSKITANPVLYPEAPLVVTTEKFGNIGTPPENNYENRISGQSGTVSNTSNISYMAWFDTGEDSGQDTGVCGVDVNSSHRIVGGNATEIDEYPWLVLLEYPDGDLKCGGSLISKSHVLTAAHCLYKKPSKVRLSEYNLTTFPTDEVETDGGGIDFITVKILDVQWAVRHPEHKEMTSINDIGLIKMASPVEFTDFIKPICLPTDDYKAKFSTTTNFTVAGWGTDNVSYNSEVKRSVILPYVAFDSCKENDYSTLSREQHICAGGVEGMDSCRGDSGGPLMWETKSGYVIVGVVSSGPQKCGTKGAPGVYVYVYKYVNWIRNMMKGNAKNT